MLGATYFDNFLRSSLVVRKVEYLPPLPAMPGGVAGDENYLCARERTVVSFYPRIGHGKYGTPVVRGLDVGLFPYSYGFMSYSNLRCLIPGTAAQGWHPMVFLYDVVTGAVTQLALPDLLTVGQVYGGSSSISSDGVSVILYDNFKEQQSSTPQIKHWLSKIYVIVANAVSYSWEQPTVTIPLSESPNIHCVNISNDGKMIVATSQYNTYVFKLAGTWSLSETLISDVVDWTYNGWSYPTCVAIEDDNKSFVTLNHEGLTQYDYSSGVLAKRRIWSHYPSSPSQNYLAIYDNTLKWEISIVGKSMSVLQRTQKGTYPMPEYKKEHAVGTIYRKIQGRWTFDRALFSERSEKNVEGASLLSEVGLITGTEGSVVGAYDYA